LLEGLESRHCLSPYVTLSAMPLPGHRVQLSGQVADPNPQQVQLTFSGAASGQTTPDSSGHYSWLTSSAVLGAVRAVGVNGQGQSSNNATATIADAAPVVQLSVANPGGKNVILSGRVTDLDPGGRTVTFNGVVSGSVVTAPNGTFSYRTRASRLGDVRAVTTDVWGQTSATVTATLASANPTISNFQAEQGPQNCWTFSGKVTDESAAGLLVHLGGIASLTGVTATVQADGSFSVTVHLQPGEEGTATAQTTDWWGLKSNVAADLVV
jgi:hypothetical protein